MNIERFEKRLEILKEIENLLIGLVGHLDPQGIDKLLKLQVKIHELNNVDNQNS